MFEMGVPIPIQTFCLLERIASFTLKEKAWQTKAFLRGRTSVTDNWSQFNLWALELYPNNNTQKRSSPLPWDISQIANESPSFQWKSRWWFQIFFIFTPTCGRFPFWLIFFKGVETTNQKWCLSNHPFSPFFAKNFQHQKGHTCHTSNSPKKGIQERSQVTVTFFQLATPPKRKSCIFHHSAIFIFQFHQLHHLLLQQSIRNLSFCGGSGIESFSWRERRRWRVDPGFFCWAGKAFDLCRVVGFFGPFTVRSSKVMRGDGSWNVPLFLKVSRW